MNNTYLINWTVTSCSALFLKIIPTANDYESISYVLLDCTGFTSHHHSHSIAPSPHSHLSSFAALIFHILPVLMLSVSARAQLFYCTSPIISLCFITIITIPLPLISSCVHWISRHNSHPIVHCFIDHWSHHSINWSLISSLTVHWSLISSIHQFLLITSL